MSNVPSRIFLAALLMVMASVASAEHAQQLPNVVIILADDMGWGDPQCYQQDSKVPTPSIDRLATEGIRFTDAHTPSSVCTPTRYTLLTGRYCWRTTLTKGVLDGFGPPLIVSTEDTLAKMLKRQGYRTACVGKWHLGMQWHDEEGIAIERRGVGVRFRSGENVDFVVTSREARSMLGLIRTSGSPLHWTWLRTSTFAIDASSPCRLTFTSKSPTRSF